jgi:hypothetical protein
MMDDLSVHMGEPPPNFQEWMRTYIHFHGFAGLPKERGAMVESDTFTNLGHQWRFVLYPGGDDDAEQGMVSVELIHMSVEHIQIVCIIYVDVEVGPKPRRVAKGRGFKFDFDPTNGRYLIKDFAKRNDIMNSLLHGTLSIVIGWKLAVPTNNSRN